MAQEDKKCENCGERLFRAGYIPFNGGMVVCHSCFIEWQKFGEPKTVAEYHAAIWQRADCQSDWAAKN